MTRKTVVEVAAQANVGRPVALSDLILQVHGREFDVGVAFKRKQTSSTRQIERGKGSTRRSSWNSGDTYTIVAVGVR